MRSFHDEYVFFSIVLLYILADQRWGLDMLQTGSREKFFIFILEKASAASFLIWEMGNKFVTNQGIANHYGTAEWSVYEVLGQFWAAVYVCQYAVVLFLNLWSPKHCWQSVTGRRWHKIPLCSINQVCRQCTVEPAVVCNWRSLYAIVCHCMPVFVAYPGYNINVVATFPDLTYAEVNVLRTDWDTLEQEKGHKSLFSSVEF